MRKWRDGMLRTAPPTSPSSSVPSTSVPVVVEDWIPGGHYFAAGVFVALILLVWAFARAPRISEGGDY